MVNNKEVKMPYKVTHLSGRCRTGNDMVGQIAHAVSGGISICGKKPKGKSSGWSVWEDNELTCPKCLLKIKELEAK